MLTLTVDIGNSETALGLYHRDAEGVRLVKLLRFPTDAQVTGDLLFSLLHPHLSDSIPKRVAVSSVVPHLTSAWVELCEKNLQAEALVLETALIPDIEIKIPRPEEAGIDRIVNSWIGRKRFGTPLVIADFGTATTLDIVDSSGAYLGGVITPGVKLFPEALAARTAKLPRIGLTPPKNVIGRNTAEALLSGTIYGHAAMVEGLLERVFKELGARNAVATGGLSYTVRPMLDHLITHHDPCLTLDGIEEIASTIWK